VLFALVTNLCWYKIVPIICPVVGPGKSFVNMSALLLPDGSYSIRTRTHATASCTKWYANAFDFFFNVDSGILVFLTTDKLLTLTCACPSKVPKSFYYFDACLECDEF
jgi:hypothetical protein